MLWFRSLGLLVCFLLTAGAASAADLSPAMGEILPTASDSEKLPVVIFLDAKLTMDDVYPDARQLPMDQRREYVVNALKDRFAQMSPRVMERLELARKNGQVSLLRPLWVMNAIRTTAEAGILRELQGYPEITYIAYDPQRYNTLDENGWGVEEIGSIRVNMELGVTGEGVIVGHKDSGINYLRTGFEGRIWINPGEDLNGNGIIDDGETNNVDDDGNGYIDDFRGWNFDDDNNDITDRDGNKHGTRTSSVISSNPGPCDSVAVAPGATLMSLSGYFTQGAVWESSQYAIEMGANVISASLSFKQSDCDDPGVLDCPNRVAHRWVSEMELAAGIIHANSTGNEGLSNPIPLSTSSPSDCPPPFMTESHSQQGGVSSVVSVAAYYSNGSYMTGSGRGPTGWFRDDLCVHPRMSFCGPPGTPSEYPDEFNDYPYMDGQFAGLLKPDITAPTSVRALNGTNGCQSIGGTSGATPHVGGALALIYSAFPGITPEQAYQYLVNGALDAGDPGADNTWGFGMLRVYDAIFPELATHATITGEVISEDVGVEGVHVSAAGQRPVLTDADGIYTVSIPASEALDEIVGIEFSKYGYQTTSADVEIAPGETTTHDVLLLEAAAASLTLNVSHQADGPVNAISVAALGADVEATTDINGDVTLNDLFAGVNRFLIGENQEYYALTVVDIELTAGDNDVEFEILHSDYADPTGDHELIGYTARDDLDQGGPDFDWIEINPDLGGAGEFLPVSSGDRDACIPRTLPFTFHFFGQSYSSIEISPNGYVAFGSGCVNAWDIWPIPSATTPNGYCAPLWQDYEPEAGDGGSLYFYSDGEQAIIEWYDVRQWTGFPLGRATFQMILRPDEENGDGVILCQYLDVQGRIEATVGIEDADGAMGLQYAHQLQLMAGAAPLTAGRAIAFVPQALVSEDNPVVLPASFTLYQNYPNPFNPSTVFSFDAPRSSQAKLALFDLLGRESAIVFEGEAHAGLNRIEFNSTALATGVYFARLTADNKTVGIRKVMLLK